MTAEAYAEVIGSPYAVWVAPVGTTFPKIDSPSASFDPAWFELGTNGIDNQGSKGVTIAAGAQTISSFKPNGGTLKVKDWRTDEDPTVQFSLVDTTVETVAKILDDATITTTPAASGVAGQKSVSIIRGVYVKYFAVLCRGISPYDDGTGLNAQWEFARCAQTATSSLAYVLGTPAEVDCQFDIRGTVNGSDPAMYRGQTDAAL